MNKTLAFLFILAMTAAGMFAVKWQNAVSQIEADARKAARDAAAVVTLPPTNPRALLEVQRLENELQNLRVQMVNQRDLTATAHQREVELLKSENEWLQQLLANQQKLAAAIPAAPAPVIEEVSMLEPVLPEEDYVAGLTVVDMFEFRALNWRQGTMPAAGAAVISVAPGSPAMIAGIQTGDIILSVGNTVIDGPGTFNEKVSDLLPGSATRLTLNRNRSELTVMLVRPLK